MVKVIVGLVAGMALTMILAWNMAGSLMFNEVQSPFGLEETVARIQHNVEENPQLRPRLALSGLRNPAKAVQADGGNVLRS